MTHQPAILGHLLACGLSLAACVSPARPIRTSPTATGVTSTFVGPMAQPAQLLRYALSPLPRPLDPQRQCTPRSDVLLNVVYETLVYLNEDYRIEPDLAESWEASSDNTFYTFKLNPAVRFHDGTPLDAAVVRQNIDRIAGQDSTGVALLPGYLGAEVIDRFTIGVRFDRPYPTFLRVLSGACLSILSPAAFAEDGALVKDFPAGTGPFLIAPRQASSGESLTLVRNEAYTWGPASYRHRGPTYVGSGYDANGPCRYADRSHDHAGPAFLERIELYFEGDPKRRAAALKQGIVDAAEDVPAADAERLESSGGFWVFTVPVAGYQDMVGDPDVLRIARISAQQLSAAEVLAAPSQGEVILHSARREVNCLSYGVHTLDANFYETSIRALP